MRNGSENGVKLLLHQRLYAPFLRYTSEVKTFNAYSGCSLHVCPTLFYLGYVLGPGSLSPCWSLFDVHSFRRTRDTVAMRSIAAENPAHQVKALGTCTSLERSGCFINMPYWKALTICWRLSLVCSLLVTGDKGRRTWPLTRDGDNC